MTDDREDDDAYCTCEDVWEEGAYFTDCTCEHDPDEHGWGSCDVDDCECEGGWEE